MQQQKLMMQERKFIFVDDMDRRLFCKLLEVMDDLRSLHNGFCKVHAIAYMRFFSDKPHKIFSKLCFFDASKRGFSKFSARFLIFFAVEADFAEHELAVKMVELAFFKDFCNKQIFNFTIETESHDDDKKKKDIKAFLSFSVKNRKKRNIFKKNKNLYKR